MINPNLGFKNGNSKEKVSKHKALMINTLPQEMVKIEQNDPSQNQDPNKVFEKNKDGEFRNQTKLI